MARRSFTRGSYYRRTVRGTGFEGRSLARSLRRSLRIPAGGLPGLQVRGGAGLALEEARPLVAPYEPPELIVAVPGIASDHAPEVAPEHPQPTDHVGRAGHAIGSGRE